MAITADEHDRIEEYVRQKSAGLPDPGLRRIGECFAAFVKPPMDKPLPIFSQLLTEIGTYMSEDMSEEGNSSWTGHFKDGYFFFYLADEKAKLNFEEVIREYQAQNLATAPHDEAGSQANAAAMELTDEEREKAAHYIQYDLRRAAYPRAYLRPMDRGLFAHVPPYDKGLTEIFRHLLSIIPGHMARDGYRGWTGRQWNDHFVFYRGDENDLDAVVASLPNSLQE